MTELNQDQFYLKRYIATILPFAMASAGLSSIMIWAVKVISGRSNGPGVAAIALAGGGALLLLAWLCRWFALRGQLHATSTVVVIYGGILGTMISIRAAVNDEGLLTVMPFCMTLVLIGAFFAPRIWYLLAGFVLTMTPAVILAARIAPDVSNEGHYYPRVLIFTFLTTMTFYILTSHFKRRFYNLLVEHHERATRDPLTMLLNRCAWHEQAGALFEREQGAAPVVVLYLDVDHFKKINDRHGHAVGDTVLRRVADLLRQQFDASALICRYGGEEFVVMLPEGGVHDASRRANRLRTALATHPDAHSVTISIGIAEHEPGESLDHLLMRADLALLRAKATGRDKVVIDANDTAAPMDDRPANDQGELPLAEPQWEAV